MGTMSTKGIVATEWIMSIDLVGGALLITRRQSQLGSEPCEAGRNNPSKRRAFTRLKTEREKPAEAKNCPTLVGELLMVLSEMTDVSRDVFIPRSSSV